MKNKIIYFFLVLITFSFGIIYLIPAIMVIGIAEVLMPAFSVILLLVARSKIQAEIISPLGVMEKGEDMEVGLKVINNSIFPVPKIECRIKLSNIYNGGMEEIVLCGMAGAKGKTKIMTTMEKVHCGEIIIEGTKICMYDMFRLFKVKVSGKFIENVCVFPEIYPADIDIQGQTDNLMENEEFDKCHPGDDPGEVFSIREYQAGDRMQSIHWKMSARTDQLMVKEYSKPTNLSVVFFLNMQYVENEDAEGLDEFVETAAAIARGLLEREYIYYVAWFDKTIQGVERIKIMETEDIYLMLKKIYQAGVYKETVDLEELYTEEYKDEGSNTHFHLDIERKMWKNGEMLENLCGKAREILEEEGLNI